MKNKILALVVLSLIVSMALGACSAAPAATTAPQPTDASTAAPTQAPTQAPTAAPTAAPTQASAPSTSGRVQIRWFVGLGTGSRPDQQDAQKAVVAQFNASQDKIELVLEVANYDSARDVLSTEIASGNGPDIVGPVGWLGSNSFYGQWLDLAPYIQKNNYDFSDFDPATVRMYQTADQGTVGIPFAVYPAAIFYQTKMFDEAGLAYPPTTYGTQYTMPDGTKVPWNWDTLAKIAKLLTVDKNGKDATQSGFDPNSIVQYGYDPVYQDLFHFAGFWGSTKPYSGDSKGSYKANIPDNWKAAWKFWFDGIWGSQPFIPSGAVEKSADFGSGNAFNSGKIAMSITHSWYLTYAGQAGKSYDLAVLPSASGRAPSIRMKPSRSSLTCWAMVRLSCSRCTARCRPARPFSRSGIPINPKLSPGSRIGISLPWIWLTRISPVMKAGCPISMKPGTARSLSRPCSKPIRPSITTPNSTNL
jgi:multiple sugar transport system substrate-binding protein